METIQEHNKVSSLTPRESWVEYYDRWIRAAEFVGDIDGVGKFLRMSVVAMSRESDGMAPERTSIVHSFEHPTTFEDIYYTWS